MRPPVRDVRIVEGGEERQLAVVVEPFFAHAQVADDRAVEPVAGGDHAVLFRVRPGEDAAGRGGRLGLGIEVGHEGHVVVVVEGGRLEAEEVPKRGKRPRRVGDEPPPAAVAVVVPVGAVDALDQGAEVLGDPGRAERDVAAVVHRRAFEAEGIEPVLEAWVLL
jgi:hypothetical protein